MKGICIYHGNCADGFSAAWVVWKALGDRYDYYPAQHDAPPPDVRDRDVIMVDFSYPRAVMETMAQQARSILLLDHHQTAQRELDVLLDKGIIQGLIDQSHSGAMLAWRHFHPEEEPPMLLRHVEDRDIWLWKLPGTAEILAAALSYRYEFDTWDRLMRTDPAKLYEEGLPIRRKQRKDMDEILPLVTRRMRIGGHIVPVANLPPNMAAQGANRLAREAPFAAAYWDGAEARNFSLRSRSGAVDVSEIAERFGGGGHPNAAGFRLPYERLHEIEAFPPEGRA